MRSVMDPSQAKLLKFLEIQERHGIYVYTEAQRITRDSQYHCLIEAEDLSNTTWLNFWKTYFSDEATSDYIDNGTAAELGILRTIITNANVDLQRKWKYEIGKVFSLEPTINANSSSCMESIYQAPDAVEDEAVANVMIGDALNKIIQKSRAGPAGQLAKHMVGDGDKPGLGDHSEGYLIGLEKKIKDKVLKTLRDAEE